MAQHDKHRADLNSAPQAKQPISDPTAREGRKVHTGSIDADNRGCLRPFKSKPAVHHGCGHKEDKERTYAIERKPLPHLCGEKSGEAHGMAKESARISGILQSCFISTHQLVTLG